MASIGVHIEWINWIYIEWKKLILNEEMNCKLKRMYGKYIECKGLDRVSNEYINCVLNECMDIYRKNGWIEYEINVLTF